MVTAELVFLNDVLDLTEVVYLHVVNVTYLFLPRLQHVGSVHLGILKLEFAVFFVDLISLDSVELRNLLL